MEVRENSKREKILLLMLFYASFFIIGLLLWYRFGMGWFMLMYTLRRLFISFSPLHIPIVRLFMGSEYDKELEIRYKLKGNPWFISRASAIQVMVSIILTILTFWKFNMPIYRIVELVIK
jgi:hypothetical protein